MMKTCCFCKVPGHTKDVCADAYAHKQGTTASAQAYYQANGGACGTCGMTSHTTQEHVSAMMYGSGKKPKKAAVKADNAWTKPPKAPGADGGGGQWGPLGRCPDGANCKNLLQHNYCKIGHTPQEWQAARKAFTSKDKEAIKALTAENKALKSGKSSPPPAPPPQKPTKPPKADPKAGPKPPPAQQVATLMFQGQPIPPKELCWKC